jgi:hypothetical protein
VAHIFPAIFENGLRFIGGGDRHTVKLSRAQLTLADTTMIGEEGLRRRTGRAARESVLGMSWEAPAAEHVDYYREILASPRKTP